MKYFSSVNSITEKKKILWMRSSSFDSSHISVPYWTWGMKMILKHLSRTIQDFLCLPPNPFQGYGSSSQSRHPLCGGQSSTLQVVIPLQNYRQAHTHIYICGPYRLQSHLWPSMSPLDSLEDWQEFHKRVHRVTNSHKWSPLYFLLLFTLSCLQVCFPSHRCLPC